MVLELASERLTGRSYDHFGEFPVNTREDQLKNVKFASISIFVLPSAGVPCFLTLARGRSWQNSAQFRAPRKNYHEELPGNEGRASRAPLCHGEAHGNFCEGPRNCADVCHERRLASVKKHGTPSEGNISFVFCLQGGFELIVDSAGSWLFRHVVTP